ncbi:MAG TPA: MmgE/PrpD family protein [Streptosporangiaceae bacterium]|nr:MmgE/PrpD family protein [Streptosporangiaceae bacterium]
MSHVTTRHFTQTLLDRADGISEQAKAAARTLVTDVLGVAIAGADTPEGQITLHTMSAPGAAGAGAGACAVPATWQRFDPATSALITGTMAYSIGLTDTHSQSITHPGPSVVPTALAIGELTGASDAEILRAIVLGVETVVRVGAVVNPSHRARGYHPTATCNPFGCAVTASYLLGQGIDQVLSALGIAGSMAGGLYEFRHEGSMLMALHGGWPAHSGIKAALLAGGGFTGPSTVLEGPEGFFRAFADDIRPEHLAVASQGQPWGIEELALRPYNACRYAHSGIDALGLIKAEHSPMAADDVKALTVWTHRTAVEQECEPTSLVSARLSTAFTIALTFIKGPRQDPISAEELADNEVQSLLTRTSIREDPRLTALFPREWACRVVVELTDGQVLDAEVTVPKGEPGNPLTQAEQVDKFARLAGARLGRARAADLATRLLAGAGDPPLNQVVAMLADGTTAQ